MRQYQVPQFITVEDKVIGPLTVKQALYLGAGAMLIVGIRMILEPFLLWPLAVLIGGFAAALAFLKINEQPFPRVLKNAFFYLIKPRLFIWKKEPTTSAMTRLEAVKKQEILVKNIPKMSQSKLSDLAWSLDIKEKIKD